MSILNSGGIINYFVLCAVRIQHQHLGRLNAEINDLKKKFFGTNYVEVKSDWLRNPKRRKKYYVKPYGITEEDLTGFVNALYDFVAQNAKNLKLIGVVFDKRYYGDEKRRSSEGNPLLKTVQVLFERIQYTGGYNIVTFDQFEDHLKLDRGSHEKILNVVQPNDDWDQVYVKNFDSIIDIKFIQSKRENFIQIADLCAYNIFRQFVHYGRRWILEESKDRKLEMYDYFHKIRCNFMHDPITKKVVGRGLVCIPDIAKCNWNLLEDCDL